MNIYTVDANDLATYTKYKKDVYNLKKPRKTLDYLSIDNQYVSKLCFNEALIIVDNDGKELGEFIGKIRRCNSNNSTASIMINVHSTNISENGEEIGMNLITKTTAKFDSYEEKWSQWCFENSEKTCSTVLISKKSNNEPIQVYTDLNNSELIDQTKNINLKLIKNLLTEGMNYALLRYLAIIGFEGIIKNKTAITINGNLCKTSYECSLNEKYVINKIQIPVIIIKRILHAQTSPKTPMASMSTVLTRSGYILKHSWDKTIDKELILKNTMQITKNGNVYNDAKLYLKNNWDQDIRIKSMYLDKVSELKIIYKTYIKNNKTIKDIIIDYVRDILIAKPDNVLQFLIDCFEVQT